MTEDEVSGAKLATRPLKCKASELPRWLACRDMTHSVMEEFRLVMSLGGNMHILHLFSLFMYTYACYICIQHTRLLY